MPAPKKSGLGRGLNALINNVETTENENNGVSEIDIDMIEPNLGQPRKYFDSEKIDELSESIKKHGLIQPLIVTKEGEVYKIIAGERRWRASKKAGLKKIPVVIKEVTPREFMELAIIENIQREDLNPLEEAEAYYKLNTEYSMTQDEIAESVGKSRPAITNAMRLLNVSENIKKCIVDGSLSAGHARCLSGIKDEKEQNKLAEEILKNNLNVRQTETLIKNFSTEKKVKRESKANKGSSVEIQYVEGKLREIFNTKVSIRDANNKGKIEIEYYSADERERLLEILQNKTTT